MNDRATYAACLTPPGSAAIATIAVRGPRALEVVQTFFSGKGGYAIPLTPDLFPPRGGDSVLPFHLGRFGEDLADEVVLIVKKTEPVPWIEVHCHGGHQVVQMILDTLERFQVPTCCWQEIECRFADRPLKAEAMVELTRATTLRTAAILLDQYHGALECELRAIVAAMDRGNMAEAGQRLQDLARYTGPGRHLTVPRRVAVAGPPNVGKSSLVNALAGFQRSIVSPIPGTTRDAVSVGIAIDGWPIEMIDTAGLHESPGKLEAEGIQLAKQAIAHADLCLWLIDGSISNPGLLPMGVASPVVVVTKTDLAPGWDWQQHPELIGVSALTGAGLEELCRRIALRLVPNPPPEGAAVPFTPSWCDRVDGAWSAWQAGKLEEVRQLLALPGK